MKKIISMILSVAMVLTAVPSEKWGQSHFLTFKWNGKASNHCHSKNDSDPIFYPIFYILAPGSFFTKDKQEGEVVPLSGDDGLGAIGKVVEVENVGVDRAKRLTGVIENIETGEKIDLSKVSQRVLARAELEKYFRKIREFGGYDTIAGWDTHELFKITSDFRGRFT